MRTFLQALDIALAIYTWPIFAVAVMIWLKGFNVIDAGSGTVQVIDNILGKITAPVLAPTRYFFPPPNGVDFSPLILIIEILTLRYLIVLYILPNYF
jgi:YggT family protein